MIEQTMELGSDGPPSAEPRSPPSPNQRFESRGSDLPSELKDEVDGGPNTRKVEFYEYGDNWSRGFQCGKCYYICPKKENGIWYDPIQNYRSRKIKWVVRTQQLDLDGEPLSMCFDPYPVRCNECRSKKKRWQKANRKYDLLEHIRQWKNYFGLRFVTWTRREWNTTANADVDDMWIEAERLKKKGFKDFNNFRNRNDWWKSRDAIGQNYPEVTFKPIWNGWGFDEVQVHFHIHSIVCSKYLDNKPVRAVNDDIIDDSKFQKEFGGQVDVSIVRSWKQTDGDGTWTSRRSVLRYLTKYLTKAQHWQSRPMGNWNGDWC